MGSAPPTSDADGISGYATGADAPLRATASALEKVEGARTIVLVEGISDQIAIESLAARIGLNLGSAGAVVVPIGGATAVGAYVARFAETDALLLGLCDVAEANHYSRAIENRSSGSADQMRFFVCDVDLEDELIRSLGPDATEAVLAGEGNLNAFRTLQKQAEWRGQPFDRQMRRWLGAGARRKSRYAKLFVDALDDDHAPAPLLDLLNAIES